MIPKLAEVIGKYLKNSGINTPYIPYFEKIQEYLDWYRGDTDFHKYKQWNGKKHVDKMKYSLDMAKTACEDMSSLIGIEKVDISFADDRARDFVNKVLADNDFRVNAPQLFELMFALGTCAFVDSYENNRIVLDYVHGDMIFPLHWENGKIDECAFAIVGGTDNGNENDIAYQIILYTKNEDGEYEIHQVNLNASGNTVQPAKILSQLDKAQEDIETMPTNSSIPQFHICKTNIVNNYDKTCPLGMSIFGNSINLLKSIDETFDGLHNEFKNGRKRIFVKSGLKSIKMTDAEWQESVYNQIDSNDTEFYQLEFGGQDQTVPPIYESNMSLRTNEYQMGLEMLLNMYSKKTGLGEKFYSFNNGQLTTATAVISSKSDLFRNIKKQELAVENTLISLCRSILDLGNRYFNAGFDVNQEITINFDDSIIEDTEKTQQEAMAEYNAGLIDRVEYFVITKGLTRDQAKKKVAEMEATDTMKDMTDIMNNIGFDDGEDSE